MRAWQEEIEETETISISTDVHLPYFSRWEEADVSGFDLSSKRRSLVNLPLCACVRKRDAAESGRRSENVIPTSSEVNFHSRGDAAVDDDDEVVKCGQLAPIPSPNPSTRPVPRFGGIEIPVARVFRAFFTSVRSPFYPHFLSLFSLTVGIPRTIECPIHELSPTRTRDEREQKSPL